MIGRDQLRMRPMQCPRMMGADRQSPVPGGYAQARRPKHQAPRYTDPRGVTLVVKRV